MESQEAYLKVSKIGEKYEWISWAQKSLRILIAATQLKDTCSVGEKL